MHTYDTVQIINCCNYCACKAPSFDIATGQILSSECDGASQTRTLNLKLEEAKPLFTNVLLLLSVCRQKQKFYPLNFSLNASWVKMTKQPGDQHYPVWENEVLAHALLNIKNASI